MDLVQVAVTSLVSLAAMFLLTKLMGNKQVSQMNLFDYVRVFHEITRQEADERLKDLFQKKNMSLSVVRTK